MAATVRERILLLQLKRIGDFILTAPAVAALRREHPEAEIVAVVPSSVADVAACFSGLSSVLPYRPGSPNLRTWASILAGSWDWCLDFAGTDRSALMTRLSRAKHRVGYAKFADTASRRIAYTQLCDASVRNLHTVDFHLALSNEAIKGAIKSSSTGFLLPAPMLAWAKSKLPEFGIRGPFAVIQAGSAREEKFWIAGRWAAVAEAVATEKGMQIVLTGLDDATESAHLAELRSALKIPFVDLTGKLSLIQTASVIASADLVLGVDSMAMHLAAMFERPQVVLFGPTNPFHWRPRHPRAVVVVAGYEAPVTEFQPRSEGGEMNLISTAIVTDAMRAALR